MPITADISEVIRNAPRNCWLALSDDQSELLGYGETIDAAVDAAEAKGIKEPVLLWSPEEWMPAVY